MEKQAMIWPQQSELEDAKPEALCAPEIYQKLGASEGVEDCKPMVRNIELLGQRQFIPGQPGSDSDYKSSSARQLSLQYVKV